jgi:uncharacterized protein
MEIIGYIASILIGVSIGLIGAGGSILAVPILVYLFGVAPNLATSYSLFIVGVTALFGAFRHFKLGNLHPKTAFVFAIPSVISLIIFRKYLMILIPDIIIISSDFIMTKSVLIMVVFATLMILASYSMIRQSGKEEESPKMNYIRLILIGLVVGVVTGFLGAGGGFLIIPALILFGGLPMKQAIGTSLFIIFINSFIGFSGDMINGVELNLQLLFSISAIAILGMLLGVQMSKKIAGAKLKPAFGWFVLVMGVYIIAKELLLK